MSNHPRRRPGPMPRLNGARRLPAAAPRGAPPAVCMTYGMTSSGDPTEIEEAKQVTHDQLIERLGDRRSGPVYWRIVPPVEVPGVLRTLAEQDTQVHYEGETTRDDAFASLRRHLLEHPDAHLVIAQAAATVS
jgi:hypothetical protein